MEAIIKDLRAEWSKMVSTRVLLLPRGYMVMSGDKVGCHHWRNATSTYWARDVAKYPTMHMSVPTMNYPARNVNNVENEETWFGLRSVSGKTLT